MHIYILTAEIYEFVFSFFGKLCGGFLSNITILFTLLLSRFVSINLMCCYVSLATKCEFGSKFNCFGSLFWLFWYFFCPPLPKQLRKAHHRGSATLCITYCCGFLSVCNRTISTVGHGICLFSESNFKH